MENTLLSDQKKGNFNVLEVPLRGSNLVEASAGTGKTYSLALLALRLLLEKNEHGQSRKLTEILLITFTEKAVAELKLRVRLFIQKALLYAQNLESTEIVDSNIQHIVQQALSTHAGIEEIIEKLQRALLNFDEASIQTIHSFCWQTLRENALESGISFSVTINTDTTEIRQQFVHEFIRNELSVMDTKYLDVLNIGEIYKLVTRAMELLSNGYVYETSLASDFSIQDALHDLEQERTQLEKDLLQFEDELKAILADSTKTHHIKLKALFKNFREEIDQILQFDGFATFKFFQEGGKGYHEIWSRIVQYQEHIKELEVAYIEQILYSLVHKAYIPYVTHLKNTEVLTFDSIINELHNSLIVRNNKRMLRHIREQYTAVFIDEFQDTDRIQAEIVEKLFLQVEEGDENNTLLFLIGDPKQSIYAFRNADVASYLEMRNKMQHQYNMTTNYRSSEAMVHAVNLMYEKMGIYEGFGFDPQNQNIAISYEKVQAANAHISLEGYKPGIFNFFEYENKDSLLSHLAIQIANLLDENNQVYFKKVEKDGSVTKRKVEGSDIGVLVKTNNAAKEVQEALRKIGISSVLTTTDKILKTQEAKDLLTILEAMRNPVEQSIRKALYATFLADTQEKDAKPDWIQKIDIEQAFQLFSTYKALLAEHKIYQALYKAWEDFSLRQHFSKNPRWHRTLANVDQLTQIIQEKQYQTDWGADDAILWLSKEIENPSESESEQQLQLETDKNSLTISTIHKAKGLEYPIVFLYGFNENTVSQSLESATIHGEKKLYLDAAAAPDIRQTIKQYRKQETFRLLYVAITRSIYLCNVLYTTRTAKAETLSLFTKTANKHAGDGGISWQQIDSDKQQQVKKHLGEKIELITPISFNEEQARKARSSWFFTSFSKLSRYQGPVTLEALEPTEPYDIFVLKELGSGATFGSLIHQLLEQLDFGRDYSSYEHLDENLKKQIRQLVHKDDRSYMEFGAQLIHHVLHATIPADKPFQMSDVKMERCIPELTFYFHIDREDNVLRLKNLLEGSAQVHFAHNSLRGMMDGAIDLFFEHQGKYYILDWKSNHLGYDLALYEDEKLHQAMIHHNYTLQYYIYTVAACRYLKSKKPDFDYERDFGGAIYLFIRGNRAGKSSGVYFDKPDSSFIDELMSLL